MGCSETSKFRKLLQELQAGSSDAARELSEMYGEHVLRCVRQKIRREMRPRYDSLDFVQLVWKAIFTEPTMVEKCRDPKQFVQLLAGLAQSQVSSVCRRLQTQKRAAAREVPFDETSSHIPRTYPLSRDPTPSSVAIFREQWARLVEGQPTRTKQIVAMRYEGSTFDEIARQLNIDESTARKIIRRLKKRRSARQEVPREQVLTPDIEAQA
jgi:RNA polymerase sigma factor (sigma-70 family)